MSETNGKLQNFKIASTDKETADALDFLLTKAPGGANISELCRAAIRAEATRLGWEPIDYDDFVEFGHEAADEAVEI